RSQATTSWHVSFLVREWHRSFGAGCCFVTHDRQGRVVGVDPITGDLEAKGILDPVRLLHAQAKVVGESQGGDAAVERPGGAARLVVERSLETHRGAPRCAIRRLVQLDAEDSDADGATTSIRIERTGRIANG